MISNTSRLSTLFACAIGFVSVLPNLWAGASVFSYTPRDLILNFRKTGDDGGSVGADDFEVDLGQASNYYGAAAGVVFTNTQFNAAQLAAVFDNNNDTSWSVGGGVPAGDGGDPSIPTDTMWVTAPRSDPNVLSIPWTRSSPSTQGSIINNKIQSIGNDAVSYSGTVAADPTNNSPTTISIPTGNGFSADTYLGPNADYGGKFQGSIENTTPPDFISDSLLSRSDLYELRPSTTQGLNGHYLGYFELRPAGVMVFVAASGPDLTFTRAGNVSTISFTSITTNVYTLFVTNTAGLTQPTSTWQNGGHFTGDGNTDMFQDTTSDASRVYRVKVN